MLESRHFGFFENIAKVLMTSAYMIVLLADVFLVNCLVRSHSINFVTLAISSGSIRFLYFHQRIFVRTIKRAGVFKFKSYHIVGELK